MRTIREAIDRHAAAQPAAPFIFAPEPGVTVTYGEFRRMVRALCAELAASGIQGVFDNVRLSDSTATPEPGVMSMFAGGLGAIVLLGRRLRRQ